jgi:hypothetical protein
MDKKKSILHMRKVYWIISFVFLSYSNYCFAQLIGDSLNEAHIRNGINFVYNLSFDSARIEFQQVAKARPDHPAGYFFLAMVEWWKIVIEIDNESNDEKFISMLERVIDICDQRLDKNENDLTALFFKGGSVGFRGRLRANREDWIKAANDGRVALPIVHEAFKLAPNNEDVLFGIGIYNYYAAVIPEIYPIVKPLMIFFRSGDKQKGIQQLHRASEKAPYANIEASYFLLQILFNYEKEYGEALSIALNLNKRFPNNVIFHKYVGRCYASLSRWNEMHQTFTDILQRVNDKMVGYNTNTEREAQFYLGLFEMNEKKHDIALQHFYRCDELSRSLDKDGASGFMVASNMKIGMIYDLQAKRDLAIQQYKKIMDMKEYQDSHTQAKGYLKNPYGKF